MLVKRESVKLSGNSRFVKFVVVWYSLDISVLVYLKVIRFLQAKIRTYEMKGKESRRQALRFEKLQIKVEKQRKQHEITLRRYEEDNRIRKILCLVLSINFS